VGEHHSIAKVTLNQSASLSMTWQSLLICIDVAIRRNLSGMRSAFESSTSACCMPSSFTKQSIVLSGSPKTAEATLKPSRGLIGFVGIDHPDMTVHGR
jgi:hypothetical protein